jgi:hypothetical protein
MGRIDLDPSADDDQAVTDRKNDFVHGLLGQVLLPSPPQPLYFCQSVRRVLTPRADHEG